MPFRRDDGSALMADLIVGAVVVLVVASTTVAVGVVTDARQSSREAARSAAVILARTGDFEGAAGAARRLGPPGSSAAIDVDDGVARVRVAVTAELPHPVASGARIPVTETVLVPIAPYRSNRG